MLKRYVPVFQERAVDDDLLETGKRNLQEYFQGQGYYDVSVDFMVQPVRDDQETVEYAITRGMRYKLVRVLSQAIVISTPNPSARGCSCSPRAS